MPNFAPFPQVWGGIECTINRVGDHYKDQLDYSGHYGRPGDIDLLISTGIRALRYPVLWERHASEGGGAEPDFSFAEAALSRLQGAGVRPVVGLVHHGSGPRAASFFDGSFERGLAAHAACVAERFPWVDAYTPVNEPLTTARFCGLYGLWYPHGHKARDFYRVLMAECRATALAMAAVRRVNPAAQLVHTEDLGKTYSTPDLAYQAAFENERRWLGLDILCGRVVPGHSFWNRMIHAGIRAEELYAFADAPCPPDILGFNYYVTSERYLDTRLARYPGHTHGGNGRHRYADVELVRVPHDGAMAGAHGPRALLREVAERYPGIPLALTEVHLHCGREEQMRWWNHLWTAACDLRSEGVDLHAVTSWAMLGSCGWNALLANPERGACETGAFCVEGGAPRPTALVPMLQAHATGRAYHHPVLKSPGWWEKPSRILYGQKSGAHRIPMNADAPQPLIILGKTGTLGRAFAQVCAERGIPYKALSRADLDLCAPGAAGTALDRLKPWAVVNAAGYVRVDDAEADAAACYAANADGPAALAAACAARGLPLLTFSSDLVFDGAKSRPYTEKDIPKPLNVYGRSKAAAEKAVLGAHPGALVVRTSSFFGPWDNHNFVAHVLRVLEKGGTFSAMHDSVMCPTYVPHLVHASLELLLDRADSIYHLCGGTALSWFDWAQIIARGAGFNEGRIHPVAAADLHLPARRPAFSAMASERVPALPSLEVGMQQYLRSMERSAQAA